MNTKLYGCTQQTGIFLVLATITPNYDYVSINNVIFFSVPFRGLPFESLAEVCIFVQSAWLLRGTRNDCYLSGVILRCVSPYNKAYIFNLI
jgi:hypothetical protein